MNRIRHRSLNVLAAVGIAGIVAAACGMSVPSAHAAAETYSVDATHSNVGFSIVHFFAKVPGRFTKIEGTFTLDPDDYSKGEVNISIDPESIDTANEDRDNHLRGPDFFDVAGHPKITFASTKVLPAGKNKVKVEGTLTLHGVSQPVTLDVDVLGMGPDAWGGYRSGIEARTTINRKDFGISWNKVLDSGGFVLGDEVDILINIEGVRQEAEETSGGAGR